MKRSFHRLIKIEADAQGNLPTEIELLHAGTWHTPWHGDFGITASDLQQFVDNFNAGTARVNGTEPLPINLGHDAGGAAAGRMPSLEVRGNALVAPGIEWTGLGKQELANDTYRYISPEFNPRAMPYEDPEQAGSRIDNVLSGAALTNIPLFKKLKPVMASEATGGDNDNKGDDMPTLEDVRAKKPDELTEEDKTFLAEHKDELNDEERKTFGLSDDSTSNDQTDDDTDSADDNQDQDDQQDQTSGDGVNASAKPVTISASELAKLKADAEAGRAAKTTLDLNEATAFVAAHVKVGRIKASAQADAVTILLASSGEQRKKLEKFMNELPENKLVTAGELGSGAPGTAAASATDELITKAKEIVTKSEGKTKLADAYKQVLDADATLRERVNAERAEQ